MAKDNLKFKDIVARLVTWIKKRFSETDAKIEKTESILSGGKDGQVLTKFNQKAIWMDGVTKEDLGSLASWFLKPATNKTAGIAKLLENENSVLYSQYRGTAAGVSHVDNALKSMEVGVHAQLALKQDKIKIVSSEPTASSTSSDPDGTIYFKI